jgi:hypothetical protein
VAGNSSTLPMKTVTSTAEAPAALGHTHRVSRRGHSYFVPDPKGANIEIEAVAIKPS